MKNKSTYTLCEGRCESKLPFLPTKADLLVADPPYNFGQIYDLHDDNKPFDEYMAWTKTWLAAAHAALSKQGSMWLFYPDQLVSWVDVFCQAELGLHKRSQVVWFYTFGVANQGRGFSRSHCHLLYYTKTKTKFTFNGPAVAVPSARALIYKDKRANPSGKMPDDTWLLLKSQMEECFQPDMDTWLENRVCGTYEARQKDSPNQIPVPLLERIILATSNLGDLVVDPFNGSGSTGVAALSHGRNYVGMDISLKYLQNTARRFAEQAPSAVGEIVHAAKAKPKKRQT